MSIELYLAFVLASALLALTPGPGMSLIVANSTSYGISAGLITVAGVSTGLALLVMGATLGMSSVLALMAEWFDVIRWIGAAYLIWLGGRRLYSAFNARPDAAKQALAGKKGHWYWQGVAVSLSNPKVLLFLGAFFPQFVNPDGNLPMQFFLLAVTFVVAILLIDGAMALAAGSARRWFTGARMRIADGLSGVLLVCGGLWLAFGRRA